MRQRQSAHWPSWTEPGEQFTALKIAEPYTNIICKPKTDPDSFTIYLPDLGGYMWRLSATSFQSVARDTGSATVPSTDKPCVGASWIAYSRVFTHNTHTYIITINHISYTCKRLCQKGSWIYVRLGGPRGWPSNTGTHFLNPSTREAFRLSGEMRFHLSAKYSSSCLSAISQSRFAGVAWNLLFANAKGCFVLKTDEYVHHNPRSWSTILISTNHNQLYNHIY